MGYGYNFVLALCFIDSIFLTLPLEFDPVTLVQLHRTRKAKPLVIQFYVQISVSRLIERVCDVPRREYRVRITLCPSIDLLSRSPDCSQPAAQLCASATHSLN